MRTRLQGLQERMSALGIHAAILTHPRDVLYYAGTARPATLLIGPEEAVLFVRRGLEPARQEATVKRVEPGGGFDQVAAALTAQGLERGALGVEMDVLPARLFQRAQEAFPHWELVDVTPPILSQRMIKEPVEVEATRQAAKIADAGQVALQQALAPGRSELALAAEVEAAMRRAGHEGHQPLRYPGGRGGGVFLISGENLTVRGGHGLVVTGCGLSPASPYGASRRRVQPGDLVVLDIGAACQGYTADESRTYVLGQPTPPQEALFEVALAVEEAVLSALRPGVSVAHVYAMAEATAARGAPPHFAPGTLSLPGFVGHGIGLELDEPPVLWEREETRLEAEMVLAIEVEVNAPAAGLMAKVEDTVVVKAEGPLILTTAARQLIAVAPRD